MVRSAEQPVDQRLVAPGSVLSGLRPAGREIAFPASNLEDAVKTMELIDMIRDSGTAVAVAS